VSTAVVTFVYNESVNLPIWRKYYASLFGERNLFIIDHDSSDGSTADLGQINKLWIAKDELNDHMRCVFMASFAKALLQYFKTVIYTDCDEIIVPDPARYADLPDYLDRNNFEYVAPVGLNVQHILSKEEPLDLARPILQQRRFVRFTSSMCKPLVTRIPIVWASGFHACDKPIRIDSDLFLMHLKTMDRDIALRRQKITREMKWAESSIEAKHGVHQRYDDDRFLREQFLDPNNIATSPERGIQPFDFSAEIERIVAACTIRGGIYTSSPYFMGRVAEIPERLRNAF
jgi:hypothetical protein